MPSTTALSKACETIRQFIKTFPLKLDTVSEVNLYFSGTCIRTKFHSEKIIQNKIQRNIKYFISFSEKNNPHAITTTYQDSGMRLSGSRSNFFFFLLKNIENKSRLKFQCIFLLCYRKAKIKFSEVPILNIE